METEKVWFIKSSYNLLECEELLLEGWEPFAARKGDFVLSGFSWGWAFSSTMYYFKKLVTREVWDQLNEEDL